MNKLSILKGEYFLENLGLKLKLIVDYKNKGFSIEWIEYNEAKKDQIKEMEKYAGAFAKEMIKSKSERNFYKPLDLLITN